MTYLEFVRLVRDMRALQREYFRTKDNDVLERCKTAERSVDHAVRTYFEKPTPLFREGER